MLYNNLERATVESININPTNITQFNLNGLAVNVTQKSIKNLHLSVYPSDGSVRISAPHSMSLDTIRIFVISKLDWIKKQQQKFQSQQREVPRDYIESESHYLWGKRYLLTIIEHNHPPKLTISHKYLRLYIRPETSGVRRRTIMYEWYRQQLKDQLPDMIAKYQKLMGVEVKEFGVKRMKTRWGSCNTTAQRIWLNLELAKKPLECLEYVVVHEMTHLLEPTHNNYFVSLMDRFMPKWRFYQDELNRLSIYDREPTSKNE